MKAGFPANPVRVPVQSSSRVTSPTPTGLPGVEHGKTCPSSYCAEGAILLGVVGPQGRVIFREEPTKVDKEFVETASQGRAPEKRFRFAHKCVECGCKQWAAGKCGVIDLVLSYHPQSVSAEMELPKCSIRQTCRWFSQRGAAACVICPLITTDAREDVDIAGAPRAAGDGGKVSAR